MEMISGTRIYGAGHMFSLFSVCKAIGETQLLRPVERSLSTNILQHQNPQLIFISSCRIIRKQNVIDFAAGNLRSDLMEGEVASEDNILCEEVI